MTFKGSESFLPVNRVNRCGSACQTRTIELYAVVTVALVAISWIFDWLVNAYSIGFSAFGKLNSYAFFADLSMLPFLYGLVKVVSHSYMVALTLVGVLIAVLAGEAGLGIGTSFLDLLFS